MNPRVPPHSLEAEQSVLGACFIAESALDQAGELLTSGDFYDLRNRLVYSVMLVLRNSGLCVAPAARGART